MVDFFFNNKHADRHFSSQQSIIILGKEKNIAGDYLIPMPV